MSALEDLTREELLELVRAYEAMRVQELRRKAASKLDRCGASAAEIETAWTLYVDANKALAGEEEKCEALRKRFGLAMAERPASAVSLPCLSWQLGPPRKQSSRGEGMP